MSKPTIRSSLPPIYGRVLDAVFDAPRVEETRATCDACQMCDRGDGSTPVSATYFRPDTKCCTYHPTLPNYLVGALLADPRPEMEEGKRRVRAQIAKRVNVTPQRLAPSKKWTLVYHAAMEASFGRSELLRCPYLDEGGRCTIWHHREAVCFTFFCKYDLGAYGSEHWKELRGYLSVVEQLLSTWAAKQVSTEVKDPRRAGENKTLTLEELEERAPEPAVYADIWGPWVGREEELYVACHEKVKALTREEFAKIVDKTNAGRAALAKVGATIENLRAARHVPGRVALNKQLRVLPADGAVVMTTPYNSYDSIAIERELYDILASFRHEDTLDETRKRLETEQGIELADELLAMFAMHEILVGPPKGGTCDPGAAPVLLGVRCAAPSKKT